MASPLDTGAGIVGVIGLTIQITQVVIRFGMDWKDAPENVKTFMFELGTLKTVLSEANTNILLNPDFEAAFQNRPSLLLSQLGPNAPSTTDTKRMLDTCQRKLEVLLKELQKRCQGHRLGWERLKAAFLEKDTRESVENLCRQYQTLNNMLSIDSAVLGATTYKEVRHMRKEQHDWRQVETMNSLAIRSGVDQSNRWQENQDCQVILNWLTPVDYTSQQSDFISRRQEGTGQWFLDSAEFHAWVKADKQTLFCPGIPGAGKTIITSIVVDKLAAHFHNDNSVGIAYLYCNFRRQTEQNIGDLLRSLLKQLSQGQSSLPESVRSLYNSYKDRRTRPSLDEISRALQSVSTTYKRVFIFVDALDECQITGGQRMTFLSEIFKFQSKCGVNLFATSRHMPEIIEIFQGSIILEILAHNYDVQRYIDGYISYLPSFVQRSPDLQEEVKNGIVNAIDGMFLLAQLHLGSLVGKRSPKAVRAALKTLPSGFNAYDHAYKDAMIRIEGQVPDQVELAKQVLSWITCAKRPLTTSEILHALAVEKGESKFDEDNLPDLQDLITVCAGLVTVTEESSIIRLVHYTAQEYFQRTQSQWFPNANGEIATICVTYLSFDTFNGGYCQTDGEFEERLQLNKLYDYAAHNWGHHARAATTLGKDVIGFLQKQTQVEASSQALLAVKGWSSLTGYSKHIPKQISGLHLVGYFGVSDAARDLLIMNPDPKDSNGRTPLSWAAEKGHEPAVKLLLDTGKVNADSRDIFGRAPLSWAAENGHKSVVKLLLDTEKVDADLKDKNGRTSLSWAAQSGHEPVVKLLLGTGMVDTDSKDRYGWTPLAWSAEHGHEPVVKLLIDTGKVDIDLKDNNGRTPLLWACRNGHESVVKLLLDTGKVDADSEEEDGRTLLSWAAENGHESVAKLLLDTGKVDVDSKDVFGQTPLSWAAESGHAAIIQLLLNTGNVDADSKNASGWTPLWRAAINRNEAIVRLLLDTGTVDADLKDNKYSLTPLWWAAEKGHAAVVQLLLDTGKVDADSKDIYGRTPLSWAAARGYEAVVQLLLDTGKIDPDSKDIDGCTPLWWAAWNGHDTIEHILLKRGAMPIQDLYGLRTLFRPQ